MVCSVSHEALRDHAERAHLSGTDATVFDAYRELIEQVASDAYDAEGPPLGPSSGESGRGPKLPSVSANVCYGSKADLEGINSLRPLSARSRHHLHRAMWKRPKVRTQLIFELVSNTE